MAHHSWNRAVLLLSVIITVTSAVPCLSFCSVKLLCYNDKLIKKHPRPRGSLSEEMDAWEMLVPGQSFFWQNRVTFTLVFIAYNARQYEQLTTLHSFWWPFFAGSRCFPLQSALLKIPKASRHRGKDGGWAPAHEGRFISPKVTCLVCFAASELLAEARSALHGHG